jgi:hypothetical protein
VPTPIVAVASPTPSPTPEELPADRRDPSPTKLRRPFSFEGHRPPFSLRKSLMPPLKGTRSLQKSPDPGADGQE